MSLRAERSNLPPVGSRLLRRYAPRNDLHRFEIVAYSFRGHTHADTPPQDQISLVDLFPFPLVHWNAPWTPDGLLRSAGARTLRTYPFVPRDSCNRKTHTWFCPFIPATMRYLVVRFLNSVCCHSRSISRPVPVSYSSIYLESLQMWILTRH